MLKNASLVTGAAPRWFLLVDALHRRPPETPPSASDGGKSDLSFSDFAVPSVLEEIADNEAGSNANLEMKASVVVIAIDFARSEFLKTNCVFLNKQFI